MCFPNARRHTKLNPGLRCPFWRPRRAGLRAWPHCSVVISGACACINKSVHICVRGSLLTFVQAAAFVFTPARQHNRYFSRWTRSDAAVWNGCRVNLRACAHVYSGHFCPRPSVCSCAAMRSRYHQSVVMLLITPASPWIRTNTLTRPSCGFHTLASVVWVQMLKARHAQFSAGS